MSRPQGKPEPFADLAAWVFIPFAQGMSVLVTAGAFLCCLAAAGMHLIRLRRAGDGSASLATAVILLVTLLGAFLISTGGERIVPVFAAGLIATGVCFLAVFGSLALRRNIGDVGVALPLYLTGVAVLLYPTVLFFFALGNSGLGC